jgi:short subunit dehydrogenase-like uncharacterized protein
MLLGSITRMKTSPPLIAFVVLLVVHSLVSLAAYRFLTTTTRTPLPVNSTPVETTTAAERAQGKSSFRIMTESAVVTRKIPYSVRLYVIFGYAALAVALVIALIDRFRPSTT